MSSSPAEPGARDPRELSAEDAVDVDLIPPRVVLPKVRRAVAVGLAVTVVIAVVVAVLAGPVWGTAVLVAGAAPGLGGYLGVARRRVVLDHRVLTRRTLRTQRVNLMDADEVDLVAEVARLAQVSLRIRQGRTTVRLPVALYEGPGRGRVRGRELPMLGTRRLAEALDRNRRPEVRDIGRVLAEQSRSQASSMPMRDRPLFRAAGIAREVGGADELVFTADEVDEIARPPW
ncbi:hypothetical protein [Tsukamurella paurometabola]|uniref:Uncharacterized protein n=1 Tax=Tsukamurella paurometabola TaxID=2061 RepID=A0A3P8K6J3_TSUPA|nr:hypothetical protein [Tsukamurella paurometabola]MBS4099834.1 hypothetical protein [Tsukamurella paurometabola]UEA83833.1 hypothetical protein LK411_03015 [Tsukamurella paurometabola]VDR40979.1 Uncharacterised protein [Tsukamurella paurometabola]